MAEIGYQKWHDQPAAEETWGEHDSQAGVDSLKSCHMKEGIHLFSKELNQQVEVPGR
jgi:hypothetical protein